MQAEHLETPSLVSTGGRWRHISLLKRKTLFLVFMGVLIVCALAIRYRYSQTRWYPRGGGRSELSPNERFAAHAFSMVDENVFGLKRYYYDFRITEGMRGDAPVLVQEIVDQKGERMIGWREQGTIQWAQDSSQVTFIFGDDRLTLTAPK